MAFTRIQIDPHTKERPEQYCVFHEKEKFWFYLTTLEAQQHTAYL